ncbi:MAG: glycosyltransferase family 4 protein, partial [Candidatus Micrarchaeota archaeon]|nr:glycosyltransferase family 4 protein [Candidatus Micrarchaeota archaeon]
MRLAYYTETYIPNMDGVVKSIVDSRTQLEAMGDEVYIFTCGTKELIQANKDPRVFYYDSIPF